jgi:Putative quorum-sensing-regulated virulence factor
VSRMPFGRHRGVLLVELPPDYLTWLLGLELREPLRSAVEAEAERRQQNAHTPPAPHTPRLARDALPHAREIVRRGFRALVHELHPDHGGPTSEMARLNKAMEWLRTTIERGAA